MRLVSLTRSSRMTARMAITHVRPARRRARIGWITVAALLGVIGWGATAHAQYTVTLTSNPNPSTFGQAVTLTATVTPATTGSVDFDYRDASGIWNGICTSALSGSQAQCVTSSLSRGHIVIRAALNIFPNNYFSNLITQTVTGTNPTSTSLTSDINPSIYGQNVKLTATVTPAGPTGRVSFTCAGTEIGTAAVNTQGVAVLTTPYLLPPGCDLTA